MIVTLLRLSTKYQVEHLRRDLLTGLKPFWPATLPDWDAREARAIDAHGAYEPRESIPHPMWVPHVLLHSAELLTLLLASRSI
jgi:hypothetical protein